MFSQINPLNKSTAAAEMFIMLLVAFVLGYLTHWIICAYRHSEASFNAEEEAQPEDTVSDNLTRIEGIGPKIEKLLNKELIYTFEDVAAASPRQLRDILESAGSRYMMHDPRTWPKQAQLAAAGEWTKLKRLQERLTAGK